MDQPEATGTAADAMEGIVTAATPTFDDLPPELRMRVFRLFSYPRNVVRIEKSLVGVRPTHGLGTAQVKVAALASLKRTCKKIRGEVDDV
jgi:hypothetical protein